jgi:hypothetical protein
MGKILGSLVSLCVLGRKSIQMEVYGKSEISIKV